MRTVETPNKTRGYVRWADASWRDEARQEHLDRLAAERAAAAAAWRKAHPWKAFIARLRAWWRRA